MHRSSFIGDMCHIAQESVLISVQRYSIWQRSLDSLTFRNNKRLNCIKASKTATVHLLQRAEHTHAICGSLILPLAFFTRNNLKFVNGSFNCLEGQKKKNWGREQLAGFYFDFCSFYSTDNISPSVLMEEIKWQVIKIYLIKGISAITIIVFVSIMSQSELKMSDFFWLLGFYLCMLCWVAPPTTHSHWSKILLHLTVH